MKQEPPELTAIHPDTGFAFRLEDEAFRRWWAATVLPEDANEFVHLYRGTIEEARFVCAMDYIISVQRGEWSTDNVVYAYFLAKNQPVDMKDTQARTNAHYLSNSDAVRYLLDRVRSRSRRVAEERIAARTTAKIEELFDRSLALEGKERLETERAALETSIKFMGNQARERGQESDRRAKKAIQAAVEESKNYDYDTKRLPSLAEAKLHLAMLIDGYGTEAIKELVEGLTPLSITDGNPPHTQRDS
jgi:hypothetical protein